jgi:hypothetical protein
MEKIQKKFEKLVRPENSRRRGWSMLKYGVMEFQDSRKGKVHAQQWSPSPVVGRMRQGRGGGGEARPLKHHQGRRKKVDGRMGWNNNSMDRYVCSTYGTGTVMGWDGMGWMDGWMDGWRRWSICV